MNEKNRQHFKQRLTEWLEELNAQNGETLKELRDYQLRQPDGVDLAMEESRLKFLLRIRGRESRLIGKIQTALEDIEQGVYGICQVCGKDIGLKRLEARPVTHHCIRCKVALELRERLRG
jgi:DnaK suppressor protein